MTALIVVLAILTVLLLLLLAPVSLYVAALGGETTVLLRYLFIKINLAKFTEEQDTEAEKEKKAEKEQDKKAKKEKKKKQEVKIKRSLSIEELLSIIKLVREQISNISRALKLFLRYAGLKFLRLELMITGENAADAATKYGRACAVVYPAVALLTNTVKTDELYLNLYPGYWQDKDYIALELEFKSPMWLQFLILGKILSSLIPAAVKIVAVESELSKKAKAKALREAGKKTAGRAG